MDPTEQEAHDQVLRWCRSTPRGFGIPCMRNGVGEHRGLKLIVDNNRWASPVLFSGATWVEILAQLPEIADA